MIWLALSGVLVAIFVGFVWYLRRQIRLSSTLPPGCLALLREPILLTPVQFQYTVDSEMGDSSVEEWMDKPEEPGFVAIVMVDGRRFRLTCEPSSRISTTDRIGTSLFDERMQRALPLATSLFMVECLIDRDAAWTDEDLEATRDLLRLFVGKRMLAKMMRV